MHDPVRLDPLGRLPLVEHQGLFHPDVLVPFARENRLIRARRLPVPGPCCAVRPYPVRVLPIPGAEEVPLAIAEHRLI